MDLRAITPDEVPAFVHSLAAEFHEDVHPDDLAVYAAVIEPDRSLAVFDGPGIVATSGVLTRELTVPGGLVPVAAVTMVGVLATHRRRGLLTRMMRRQLDDVRAAGEPVAALWASEPVIYRRFGYGLAARHAEVRIRTAGFRLRPGAPEPEGRMTFLAPADAVPRVAPLYDRVRRARPGHLDRPGRAWEHIVYDPEHEREGRSALRAAVHEAPGGEVDGYVLYAVKHGDWADGPDGEVHVRDLLADGPAATSALWAFLLGLDLTRALRWELAPPDEPLHELLEGPQLVRMTLGVNLWVRLVDVGAALAARTYSRPVDVVLEIDDDACPWNAGRWRLAGDETGAACARTGAAPDLALSAGDLGAAYLGGSSLAALHAAGRVRELRAGALAPTAAALRGAREPFCADDF